MRILVANPSLRRIAGTEIYLEDLLEELARRGVESALFAEADEPQDRAPIHLPEGTRLFRNVQEAAAWKPTVSLSNGRLRPEAEEAVQSLGPSAYFIHNFHGTCISGLKRHQYPQPEPCFRRLGLPCLALYLPRGCGGKNPFTMFELYQREQAHQERLRRYRRLITHSEAMREEYQRHGFAPERIHVIPFACVRGDGQAAAVPFPASTEAWRIFFAGRMEAIKGGAQLIGAVRRLAAGSRQPIRLTMAGEGEQRGAWESLARAVVAQHPNCEIVFPGWMGGQQLAEEYRQQHVFVMPSLWPEPFGKGGMEAAEYGCPSVGFRLGGIRQWLREAVNGHLADWQGNAEANLAEALQKTFVSREHYQQLRQGASAEAQRYTAAAHCDQLLPILAQVAAEGGA